MAKRGRSSLLWVTLSMGALLLAGCSGFFVNPALTAIAVNPATASISVCPAPPGSVCTVQLTATGTFNDGSTGPVTVAWTSSDSAVASVNTGGLVTGLTAGNTTITAQGSGFSGTSGITVCGSTTSITLAPLNQTYPLSQGTVQFTATGSTGQDLTTQVTWQSSSSSVATISNASGTQGLATLIGSGTTVITATACSVTASTNLTVS